MSETETKRLKVHKVTLMVTDHDDLGAGDVAKVIESTKYPNWCIHPNVVNIETREMDWHEQHPLNLIGQQKSAFAELFGGALATPVSVGGVDVAHLRELHTKLGHAERFRFGEPTNLTRFTAAAADAMPTLLDAYEAMSAPLPVAKAPADLDDEALAKLREAMSKCEPAPLVPETAPEVISPDEMERLKDLRSWVAGQANYWAGREFGDDCDASVKVLDKLIKHHRVVS